MMFDEQSRPDVPANEPEEEDVPQPETTADPAAGSDETPEQPDRRMGAGSMAAIAGSAGVGLGLGAGVGAVGSREAIDRLLDDDAVDEELEKDEDSAAELDVFNNEPEQTTETEEPLPPDVTSAARITGEAPPAPDRSSGLGVDDDAIITSETPITPEAGVGSGVRSPDFGTPFSGDAPEPPGGSEGPSAPPIPDVPDAPTFDFPDAPEAPEPPPGYAPPFPDFGPGLSAEPPLLDFLSPPDFPTPPNFGSPPNPPSPDLPIPPPTDAGPTSPTGPAEAPQPELPGTTPPVAGDAPAADIPVDPAPTFPAALPASKASPITDQPVIPTDELEPPAEAPPEEPDVDAPIVDEPGTPDVPATPELPVPAAPPNEKPADLPAARPPWGPGDDAGNGQATQPDDDAPPHEDLPQNGAYPPIEDHEDTVLPDETPAYFEYGGVQFNNPEVQGYDLINVNGNLYEYIHPETGDYISVLVNDDGTYTVWIRGDEEPGDFEMEFIVDAHGNYQGTGDAWYDEYNAQNGEPEQNVAPDVDDNAASDQPEEHGQEEDETAPPPDEPGPPLLPPWLPASFTYDGVTWPSPAGGGFTHQISHEGNEYFANEQYSVVVRDNGDGSGVILIDDRNVGQSWDIGFTFYSDGRYVPLDAYIPEEEPLDFQTQSAEILESEPADAADADEQTDDTSESEPPDTDQSFTGTTAETSTDIGNDVPPTEDRSLGEDDTVFEDEEDMDDEV